MFSTKTPTDVRSQTKTTLDISREGEMGSTWGCPSISEEEKGTSSLQLLIELGREPQQGPPDFSPKWASSRCSNQSSQPSQPTPCPASNYL